MGISHYTDHSIRKCQRAVSMAISPSNLRRCGPCLLSAFHLAFFYLAAWGCGIFFLRGWELASLFLRLEFGTAMVCLHSSHLSLSLSLSATCLFRPQALQSLSLTESRLRSRGTVLVNTLGSNTCLRKVDLSGNSMEDIGAKMLSKALQINTTLR